MAGLVFSPVHPLSVHWCRCLTLVFILLCFHGSAGQTQTAPRAPFLLLFLPASSKTTQTHQRNLPDVWGFSRWVNLQDHGGSNLSETLWPVYSLNENMSFLTFFRVRKQIFCATLGSKSFWVPLTFSSLSILWKSMGPKTICYKTISFYHLFQSHLFHTLQKNCFFFS